MNKAIILTNAFVENDDKNILINTNITKIAINHHAEDLKPDYRICSDYIITNLLYKFNQPIISIREFVNNKKIIYAGNISFKGSTMIACIEYLINSGYNEILIIGDNTVHQDFFQKRINDEIDIIKSNKKDINIYQYSNGNFNLPVMNVKEFIKERNK